MTTRQQDFMVIYQRGAAGTAGQRSVYLTSALSKQEAARSTIGTNFARWYAESAVTYETESPHGITFMWVDPITEMQLAIKELEAKVAILGEEIQTLRASAQEGEVIVLRTVDREQAKQEIRDLFATGETLYFSDIASKLRIDLPLVVEICDELIQEGDIEVGQDAV